MTQHDANARLRRLDAFTATGTGVADAPAQAPVAWEYILQFKSGRQSVHVTADPAELAYQRESALFVSDRPLVYGAGDGQDTVAPLRAAVLEAARAYGHALRVSAALNARPILSLGANELRRAVDAEVETREVLKRALEALERAEATCDGTAEDSAPRTELDTDERGVPRVLDLVRSNAEKDNSYAPYCLRCSTNRRMCSLEPFLWTCWAGCGAICDARTDAERSRGIIPEVSRG